MNLREVFGLEMRRPVVLECSHGRFRKVHDTDVNHPPELSTQFVESVRGGGSAARSRRSFAPQKPVLAELQRREPKRKNPSRVIAGPAEASG